MEVCFITIHGMSTFRGFRAIILIATQTCLSMLGSSMYPIPSKTFLGTFLMRSGVNLVGSIFTRMKFPLRERFMAVVLTWTRPLRSTIVRSSTRMGLGLVVNAFSQLFTMFLSPVPVYITEVRGAEVSIPFFGKLALWN